MKASDHNAPRPPQGLEPWAVHLIAGIVVALLLLTMVWLAHRLGHAGEQMDCVARGLRNC